MLLSSLYHIQLMSIGAKLYPPCVTRMNTCIDILLGHTNSVDCVHACSPISWSYSILGDIGERDNALLCISNQTSCYQNCKVNWFFPNGTRVPLSVAKWDIYRTRASVLVRLNRRGDGMVGLYHCEIHDSINVTHTIYIGVYNANTSTGELQCL